MKYSKQYGFTIIELSITLLISSIITLALINMFAASSQVQSLTQSTLQSQESGRLTINFLKKRVNLAGYNGEQSLDVAFHPTCQPAKQYCSYDSNKDTGDRLAIQRTMDNQQTCAETRINNNSNNDGTAIKVVDVYWVENATLYCLTYSTDSEEPIFVTDNSLMKKQPLANGISAMHLLYGIGINSEIELNDSVTKYISASDIDNEFPNNSIVWTSIKSLKISLLSESSSTSKKTKEIKYYLFDADPLTFDDGKSRNIFSTTISLMKR